MSQSALPTKILIILDRSGSMSSIKNATESGVAVFVQKQREVGGPCQLTLLQFDSDTKDQVQIETVYEDLPLEEIPAFVLTARGGTPLYDATGRILSEYESKWASGPDRPGKVIVMIITDGGDTCSKEISSEGLSTITRRLQKEHGWEINYMGANHDAVTMAAQMGINTQRAATYSADTAGTEAAYDVLANVACATRRGEVMGTSLQALYQTRINTGASGVAAKPSESMTLTNTTATSVRKKILKEI